MTLVMGVLNVTPDSFSDGGRWYNHEAAIDRGMELARDGADLIDVGGESTRPGATPVDEGEERRRVLPVIKALTDAGARVSIDTRKPAVAEAAVDAGATLINDVSASLWPVAAAKGVGWVTMHMRGDPRTMQADPRYDDVVAEVRDFLVDRAKRASAAGVSEVWIDPGIGFGKTVDHNLQILHRLETFVATGFPVVVGTSRKSFLGKLAAAADAHPDPHPGPRPGTGPDPDPAPAPVDDRLEGSLASAVWAVTQGVGMVRVHDVSPTVHAIRLIEETRPGMGSES